MNDIIDMTKANPYLNEESRPKKRPLPLQSPQRCPPLPPPRVASKMPISFSGSFAAMQALASSKSQLSLQQPPYLHHAMKCARYSDSDLEDDNGSQSSWSDSDSEDEGDNPFIMYAPTANANRGHLLRPTMSLQQIGALAVATGARKPSQLLTQRTQSSTQLRQGVTVIRKSSQAGGLSHRSASMPSMAPQVLHYRQMTTTLGNAPSKSGGASPVKPEERLKTILKEAGRTIDLCPYSSLDNFFLKVQPQHIEAFQQDIISAVRGKSVKDLKELQKKGKMLQCCNKFGESIVHMACRQSSAEVLEYLMNEAKVNIRVCCDSGRTPLHDACWTTSPDFDIIRILLKECPDFLKIKDKRGFSPLAYVPHGQWGLWGDFLEKNKDLLVFDKSSE